MSPEEQIFAIVAMSVAIAVLIIIAGALAIYLDLQRRSDHQRYIAASDDNQAIYEEARRRMHQEVGEPWRSSLD